MADPTRRALLAATAAAALAPALARADAKDDIPPVEDLMREHGVIRRDLGVYVELARRIESGGEPPNGELLTRAAELMRRFAEGYHEHLEENLLFPRLEKAGVLVPLCAVLRAQHAVGRGITDELLQLAKGWNDRAKREKAASRMRAFITMYEPHAAREDTEAFIALRKLLSAKELDALGDQFEELEHKLVGQNGFEKSLAEVEQLEKSLGIDDLSRFTAR